MRIVFPTVAFLLSASLLTGCTERSLSNVVPDPNHVEKRSIPFTINRDIDLLFVIDDSGSMSEEQYELGRSFPAFINVLNQVEGGLPNLHLGVISTNVGTDGVTIGGCSSAARPQGDDGNLLTNRCPGLTAPFLEDIKLPDGNRTSNYSGDLTDKFSCMAYLGTNGCGFEQPLESIYRALRPGKNPGFLRASAYLSIVIISDEDDCSAAPGGGLFGDATGGVSSPLGPRTSFRCHEFGVQCDNDPNPRAFGMRTGCVPRTGSPYVQEVTHYVDAIKALKSNPQNVLVAGILGNVDAPRSAVIGADPPPSDQTFPAVLASCGSSSGQGYPAFRTSAFLESFPDRNSLTSVCSNTLFDAMESTANLIKQTLPGYCFARSPTDRDVEQPGVQLDCSAADVIHPDEPALRHETAMLPSSVIDPVTGFPDASAGCGTAPVPCYGFRSDASRCVATATNPASISVDVFRAGASVDPTTVVEMQCVVD